MNSSQSPAKAQPIDPHPTPGFMAEVERECVGDTQLDCPRILPTWCAVETCPVCHFPTTNHGWPCSIGITPTNPCLPASLVGEDCGGGQ